ncbi:MAG: EF-P 5-aminopentanol modification-associated protein YfmH [Peptoanaerobacter stomatis]|uniref:EF-P 5-aminopentanol modification-associated protein YfmH n=1 Tax=Peptoanaerobacter stomatis TaxID=796937 RepID=UPI003F9ED927
MFYENKILNEKIYAEKLPNNLQVFIMKKEGFSKKYAVFATDYGSNDLEFISPHTKKQIRVNEGIAHFLEHKMFEMPDNSNAFDEFSKYGADANAYTNFNMTAYLFSATQGFKESLKHLIHYVQTPHFTDENVEKEKGIIAQEIKMYDDNPDWQLFFNCLKAMYKTHPNSIDIAGTVESIYKITPQELYDCYNSFYSPSNMALFVVGDVDIQETMQIIKDTVKDTNMFEGEITRIQVQETDETAKKEIQKELEVSIPMFCIGYKEKNDTINEDYPRIKKDIEMDIINQLIFKKGSKLHDKLYNSSLIFSQLSANYTSAKDYGYITIEGESKDIENTKNLIIEEIENFKKYGAEKEQFERVKKQKLGSFIKTFDSVESLANIYLSLYFKDENLLEYYDYLNELKIEDINSRLIKMFDKNQMVISIINPKTA